MLSEKISIIVAVYNVEEYLKKSVRSLINQSYINLEIILVNDGSTDNSGKICDALSKEDSRIRVFHKDNGGLSHARNFGLKNATGEYIAFMDSDDFVHPKMYEKLYHVLNDYNAQISVCDYIKCNKDDDYAECNLDAQVVVLDKYEAQNTYFDDRRIMFTIAPNKLFKREVVDGIFFPVGKLHEDEFTVFKYLYTADTIVYIKEPFYNYVDREGSITSSKFDEKRLAILESYIEKMEFYKGHKEYELCKGIFLVYIHMMQQCITWLKKQGNYEKAFFENYRKYIYTNLKQLEGKTKIPLVVRLECLLSYRLPILYRFIWKILK